MTMESAKGGRFGYYDCRAYLRQGKSSCRGQRVPAAKLERAVLAHLGEKLFSKERIRAIVSGIQREMKTRDRRLEGQRRSLRRRPEEVESKLTRQYEAIESGVIDLRDVGARIRELKTDRDQLQAQLAELKPAKVVPIRLYGEESLAAFQATVKAMFLGHEDRCLVKRYLKLFLDRIVVTLPQGGAGGPLRGRPGRPGE